MLWNILTDEEVRHLSVPDRLFAYADAYATAAKALCTQMISESGRAIWANGAVVLMLSAHSVELFLKGAVLKRRPNEDVWCRGHDLQKLHDDYLSVFPEPDFQWDIPFKVNFPDELPADKIAELMAKTPKPSVLYRYPVGLGGKDWHGHYGFEPNSFLCLLALVQDDYARIRRLLAALQSLEPMSVGKPLTAVQLQH